jgi:hypothetical protein
VFEPCMQKKKLKNLVFARFIFVFICVIWHFVVVKLVLKDSLFDFQSNVFIFVWLSKSVQNRWIKSKSSFFRLDLCVCMRVQKKKF